MVISSRTALSAKDEDEAVIQTVKLIRARESLCIDQASDSLQRPCRACLVSFSRLAIQLRRFQGIP